MHALNERELPRITDDMMRASLAGVRAYTVLILRAGPNFSMTGADKLIWEHGRRNFALRAAGLMPIVLPVGDGSDCCGVGVFDAAPDEVERIYAADPGVQSGVFSYEIHPCRGFPGSALPG